MKGMTMTEEDQKVYLQLRMALDQLNAALDFASESNVDVELECLEYRKISSRTPRKIYTFKAMKVLQYAPTANN